MTEDDLNRDHVAEKALKYLWDDVYRMERYEFFNSGIKSIGQLVDTYKSADEEPLRKVMKEDVYDRMMKNRTNVVAEGTEQMELIGSDILSEEQ